ncbi:hypothetical protein CEXT_786061 [Caerostris extrusa]|uniref:Uncharacterized protein n=1 Tax=Caerostris extrusa TaxID=172846 RepID=A0AAV4VPT2_CAEEX|nr:hypothetical protein CEXT_786061 [Caerostris extrusa]
MAELYCICCRPKGHKEVSHDLSEYQSSLNPHSLISLSPLTIRAPPHLPMDGWMRSSHDLSEYQSSLNPPHSYISSYHPCSSASSDGWIEEKCPDGIFYLVSTPSAGCVEEVEVFERKRNVRISKPNSSRVVFFFRDGIKRSHPVSFRTRLNREKEIKKGNK